MPPDRSQRTVRRASLRSVAPQIGQNLVAAAQTSGNDISAPSPEVQHVNSTTKKANRQQLRHETFMRRLGTGRAPYSKSHMKRLKAKAKGELSADLAPMQEALAAIEAQDGPRANEPDQRARPRDQNPLPAKRLHGQIGERKHGSLTMNQRKRAFQMENLRHKLIIADKNFASDPFQTLRTHAQNTLIKHHPTAHKPT